MKLIKFLSNSLKNISSMELNMMPNYKSTMYLPMDNQLSFHSSLTGLLMIPLCLLSGQVSTLDLGNKTKKEKFKLLVKLDFIKLSPLEPLINLSTNLSSNTKDQKVSPLVLKELTDSSCKTLSKSPKLS